MLTTFSTEKACADELDKFDPLAAMREEFYIPKTAAGNDELYFTGNSLGLQPKRTAQYVNDMLQQWQQLGVKGHFEGEHPWMPYHEFLRDYSAELVGGKPDEVVIMNSLTVNLHLMMVSFFKPTATRRKILIEEHAFPSDHYAVESQLKHHGLSPEEDLILWRPRLGEETLNHDDLYQLIETQGDEIALILLPGVQYYTGQVLDMKTITQRAHDKRIKVGFDLAHAAGNVPLALHDWQVDFACWCSYKYLNAGPGSVAGCFVHLNHGRNTDINRFAGWWGHDKETRFLMGDSFSPTPSADGWQLSNPPILSLAATRASLDTFKQAGGMEPLRQKSLQLTNYMSFLIKEELGEMVDILTPDNTWERGCQLSLSIDFSKTAINGKAVFNALEEKGITTDWREPNVIRVAPVPLYNRFTDVYLFVQALKDILK